MENRSGEAVGDGLLQARSMGMPQRDSAWFGRSVLWGEMPHGGYG